MSNEYILQMKQVVKQFPGVLALDKVDLNVKPAEVMAIIGENGAGKSTLMKIISGAFTADTGEVVLNGETIPSSMKPKDRHDVGIAIIYQELNYLDEMTISENLFMGRTLSKGKGPFKVVDYKRMFRESEKLLKEFNMDYNPRTLMKNLTVAGTVNTETGQGVFSAAVTSGRWEDCILATNNNGNQTLAAWETPEAAMWLGGVVYNPGQYGEYLIPLAISILAGENPDKVTTMEHDFLTMDDIDAVKAEMGVE